MVDPFWHKLILTTATIWMIMGSVLYLNSGLVEISISTQPRVLGSAVAFNPSPERTRHDWKQFTNPLKGYSFAYPPDWTAVEKDGFINSTHIYPPGQEFEIIYAEGEIPNIPGLITTASDSIMLDIQQDTYTVEEKMIGPTQKLFHVILKHPSRPIHVTVRTLTPDISVYEKAKLTILDIMATTEYIALQSPVAQAGFTLFTDFGFSLYYPSGLEITHSSDHEVIWGDRLLILHASGVEYPPLTKGSTLMVDTSQNLAVPVEQLATEDIGIAGEIATQKYSIQCGRHCAYQAVRFTKNDRWYELLFTGAGTAEKRVFDEIIDAIRFE